MKNLKRSEKLYTVECDECGKTISYIEHAVRLLNHEGEEKDFCMECFYKEWEKGRPYSE